MISHCIETNVNGYMLFLSRTRTYDDSFGVSRNMIFEQIISPVHGLVPPVSPFPTFPLHLLDMASHS